jgi:hypothetical protein
MAKKITAPKPRNPVAKYLRQFNKATVEPDRKKMQKNGYVKHKGKPLSISVFA